MFAMKSKRKNKSQGGSQQRSGPCTHFELLPDGSDIWRIDPLRDMLEDGAVRPHSYETSFVFQLNSWQGAKGSGEHADWDYTNGGLPSFSM